eukprot:UN04121
MTWNDDDDVNSKDWESELFGCADEISTFCYACWCPCFAAGEIYTNAEFGHCMVGCLLWCFLRGACHSCIVTSKIRASKGIRGSFGADCLAVYCCTPCQLTRELREVREIRDDRGY